MATAAVTGSASGRAIGVAPGPVEAPLLEATRRDPATRSAIEKIDIPLGRVGRPDDVVSLVAFLLGPEATWIHGAIVYVDGGHDAETRPDRYQP